MLENSNVREMSFLDHLAYKVIYQHETNRYFFGREDKDRQRGRESER